MKNIIYIIAFIVLSMNVFAQNPFTTPNGKVVIVSTSAEYSPLSDLQIEYINDRIAKNYSFVETIQSPQPYFGTFNCHFFAWNNNQGYTIWSGSGNIWQNGTPPQYQWIDDPIDYFSDGRYSNPSGYTSYIQTTDSDAPIAVYRKNGTIQHSARRLSGSTELISKWGQWGVYKHSPKEVPAEYGTITEKYKINPNYRPVGFGDPGRRNWATISNALIDIPSGSAITVLSGTQTLSGDVKIPSGVTLTIASGTNVNLNSCYSITCEGSGKIINQTGTIPFKGQYAVVSNSAKTEFRGAYQSIQTAVNNRLGDCLDVYVGPGTYSENVSLKPNMKLIGASNDATHINGTININGTIDPYDYETTWVQDLKANYISVFNSDAAHYIRGCKITQTVEASSIYSPGLVRIDNTNFLSSGYYYPGIFTDYGIVVGFNNTIEGRDQAVYGCAGNTINLVNNTCCNNHFDANMIYGNTVVFSFDKTQLRNDMVGFYGSQFSRNPAGSTINGLYSNWITWDSWSACSGLAKTSVSGGIAEETKPYVPNNDPAGQVYNQVVEKYRAICDSLKTKNEKIDFKQHTSEFSNVIADFQNIVDTYPDNYICVSALSHIIGFLCRQEKYQEAEQLIAEKLADKNYQAVKQDIKMLNMIIAHAKGDYDQALLLVDESMKDAQKDIEKANNLYSKAKIYKFGKKDKGKANELLEQIISKYSDTPIAQLAAMQLGIELEKRVTPENDNSKAKIPESFSLSNYPNPFNPSTVISYELPITSNVSIKVYDMLGREVAKLVDGMKDAGCYNATFDGSKLSSGIYFVRFIATPQDGNMPFTKTMKILMTK